MRKKLSAALRDGDVDRQPCDRCGGPGEPLATGTGPGQVRIAGWLELPRLEGLGGMTASAAIGSLAGSIAVTALSSFPRPAALQLVVGVIFGAAPIAFALAPSFGVAVALLLVVGFASAAHTAINNTLVLANAEPRFHGRVMSVYLITFAVSPVAALPMSWPADRVGAPATIAAGGLVVAAGVAGVAALYPEYRRIR